MIKRNGFQNTRDGNIIFLQGYQFSRIERESHAWTLFLTLSRQACKISRMNAKHPAKHVKSHASRKRLLFCLSLFLNLKPMHNLTYAEAKRTAKIRISFVFIHVLVPHAKLLSKVDSPAGLALANLMHKVM